MTNVDRIGIMRLGTWNLAGRWSQAHLALIEDQDCAVWLLTEVSDKVDVPGLRAHVSVELMAPRRHWAAVLTQLSAEPLSDPHPASAAIDIDGTTFCASILPWRSCGNRHPWTGQRHADKTRAAVDQLDAALPSGTLVWGGDWNHALTGREYTGSIGGRTAIAELLGRRRLHVPTAMLPHRLPGLLSIDHLAVGSDVGIRSAQRIDAAGLSDHDAYVVETARNELPGDQTRANRRRAVVHRDEASQGLARLVLRGSRQQRLPQSLATSPRPGAV